MKQMKIYAGEKIKECKIGWLDLHNWQQFYIVTLWSKTALIFLR